MPGIERIILSIMGRSGPNRGGVLMDPSGIEARRVGIGALPVVNAVLGRLGLDELVCSFLPEADPRCSIEPGRVVGVLVRNLCVGRRPLYGIARWAQGHAPELLGLREGEAARLNDDKVGRALDALFLADRASLLTELSLRVISRYRIDVCELHNDSTSITLYGAYRGATGRPRAGVRPPVPERGFSKDHRGDLKQLVEILTVSADGAVPVAHRLVDGSTEDSTTHVETWDALAAMLDSVSFTYVADCKLATRDNMDHIALKGGRFLTILPRTRKEDETGRAWIASGEVRWLESRSSDGPRLPDRRRDQHWSARPQPPQAVATSVRRRDRGGRRRRCGEQLGNRRQLQLLAAVPRHRRGVHRRRPRAVTAVTCRHVVAKISGRVQATC
jgi:Domain of unknown function (DUF4277)